MPSNAVGLDFGTTNSSIALCTGRSGEVELARFRLLGEATESYRSLLYLEQVRGHLKSKLASWTGPAGIEHYLSREVAGRQSLSRLFIVKKSFSSN